MINVDIENSWKELLQEEFNKEYFKNLVGFIKTEYSTKNIYPKGSLIFNAFTNCELQNLKVIIIGQDPYHGYNQAHGLCFSVQDGVKKPPSLLNIFKLSNKSFQIIKIFFNRKTSGDNNWQFTFYWWFMGIFFR